MKEDFLHYAWQYRLFAQENLRTVEGDSLTVIDVGQRNLDSGPDFFNAKILIGSTLWAGNVEIHLSASDWYQHAHERDLCYDTVILHVVWRSDATIYRRNGEIIPQMVLPVSREAIRRKGLFDLGGYWNQCENFWDELTPQFLNIQLSKMIYERLCRKSIEIFNLMESTKNNWEEVFYRILLKSFGMHINALPFEQLSKSMPFSYLRKHRDNLFQLEAMFLGQASLLGEDDLDEYQKLLRREYCFLSRKFNLKPIDEKLWKFSKMRPTNFPQIKIVQFASLLHHSDNMFSSLLKIKDIDILRNMFRTSPSEYWNTHYQLGKPSIFRPKQISRTTIDLLIINAVVPTIFAYSQYKEDENLMEQAFSFLESLPAEKNRVIKGWENLGVEVESAYKSQALIELKREYCDVRKCLRCGIGHTILNGGGNS